MIIAMLLAHMVGDYVLQWDALARWKGAAIKGAAFHGAIVLAVTLLFAVLIDPALVAVGVADRADAHRH